MTAHKSPPITASAIITALLLFTCLIHPALAASTVVAPAQEATGSNAVLTVTPATLEVWHGDVHRIGHLGDAQDVLNIMGHVEPWRELDTLEWSLNWGGAVPLSFRAFRRLAENGDFNADIPIGLLEPGTNELWLTAAFLDDDPVTCRVVIVQEEGSTPLPFSIRWDEVEDPQSVGQYVDGRWTLVENGLRTAETGYDRLFLVGERSWQDYEVRTSMTVHRVDEGTSPLSGGNGVGLILRFTGHVTGGHRFFPSGQPSWGYQPFGAIGWLRWKKGSPEQPPQLQFFPGDSDKATNHGEFPFRTGERYALRFGCTTLPDKEEGEGVTRYDFKIWPATETEPKDWTWQQVLTSRNALPRGGFALVAHHVDVTFGDLTVTRR